MHTPREVASDLGLSALILVLAVGLHEGFGDGSVQFLGLLAGAAAVGLSRTRPFPALVLIWLAAGLQVLASGTVVTTTIAVVITGYRLGRHGGRATAWCAGLSVPAGAATALLLTRLYPGSLGESAAAGIVVRLSGFGVPAVLAVLIALAGAPLAVGLLVRTNERYRTARTQRDAAETQAATEHDIAESRAKETRLARDVHDVVGHSLAVIIAQADSARLAAPDDATRATLDKIAAVGRSSLAEVRDVLQRTGDDQTTTTGPELDELVDGVRSAGHAVHDTVTGVPRPWDANTGTAAYRVLQELLTNALKHGAAGPIEVEREWVDHGLTLRVTNPVATDVTSPVDGMGLVGVRSRVDTLGGTFRAVVTGAGSSHARFVATTHLVVP